MRQYVAMCVSLSVGAALSGCMATFRGNELARTAAVKRSCADVAKLSVYVDTRYHANDPLVTKYLPFDQMVVKVAQRSCLFGEVTTNELKSEKADWRLKIDFKESSGPQARDIALIIGSSSLWLIPVFWTTHYDVTAMLERGEGMKSTYQYIDHATTWMHIFLAPIAQFTRGVEDEVKENMVRRLFSDIEAGVLGAPNGRSAPEDSQLLNWQTRRRGTGAAYPDFGRRQCAWREEHGSAGFCSRGTRNPWTIGIIAKSFAQPR